MIVLTVTETFITNVLELINRSTLKGSEARSVAEIQDILERALHDKPETNGTKGRGTDSVSDASVGLGTSTVPPAFEG